LTPIERFVEWRRADGTHFDPWIRTHERVGGAIIALAPQSMVIEAPVSDWEEWTSLRLPEGGTYVVDGMLAPLEVRRGIGRRRTSSRTFGCATLSRRAVAPFRQ
jgi:hypothetical protein